MLTCTDYYSELRRETLPEWPEKLRLWKRDVVEGRGGGVIFLYQNIWGVLGACLINFFLISEFQIYFLFHINIFPDVKESLQS